MAGQVVKVRRELLAACMTCPLCNKLLKEATTISECLHTFCRKCIYDKLTEEEIDSCPICQIDLGCSAVEKLRPDHNLQDVRAKIFPLKRRKVKAPEIVSASPLPIRRKERSLSSLVVSTPRVSSQTGLTGRRTKAVARKAGALRNANFPLKDCIKQEEESSEDRPTSSSFPSTFSKISHNKRQFTADSSDNISIKDSENGGEHWSPKGDLWKPLNCLVEAANRTKSFKSSAVKSEQSHGSDSGKQSLKRKMKEHKQKAQDDKNGDLAASSGLVKAKRFRKKAATSKELSTSALALFDSAGYKVERRIGPIWCSLVASDDQQGDAPLPQISASYLRIKDGSLPVSFIRKYLVKKLDLTSEDEVEIACQGQLVEPALTLHNLVDVWLQTAATSKRVAAAVGTSAKDFVMVLTYSRTSHAS